MSDEGRAPKRRLATGLALLACVGIHAGVAWVVQGPELVRFDSDAVIVGIGSVP
jgi:hypothetical protein